MSKFQLLSDNFQVPMRVKFGHASAIRDQTQTLIVLACPRSGDFSLDQVGSGEGCPRKYVTGESDESVAKFFSTHKSDLESNIDDLTDLRNWMKKYEIEIDKNPAAFCAIEGAIIDFLAKQQGETVEAFLGLPPLRSQLYYSAVLGDSRPWKFWLQTVIYWLAGFRDFKVKLSGNLTRDRSKFAVFKRLRNFTKIKLRADANNFWTDPQSCISFIRELDTDFWAIEEPIEAGDVGGQEKIARDLGVKIILDESLLRVDQLNNLSGICDLVVANVRVSKNGGLLRSMEIAQQAIKMQIPLIIGAHVGETSFLTRSGLSISSCFHDHVLAQEGGFGRLLIKQDAASPSLNFGQGGALYPDNLLATDYSGGGLTITQDIFDQISRSGR